MRHMTMRLRYCVMHQLCGVLVVDYRVLICISLYEWRKYATEKNPLSNTKKITIILRDMEYIYLCKERHM